MIFTSYSHNFLANLKIGEKAPADGEAVGGELVDILAHNRVGPFFNLFDCLFMTKSGTPVLVTQTDSGFVYILGDSKFMSQAEFDELCGNLNRKLEREQLDSLLARLRELRSDIAGYESLITQDAYGDLIHDYYREFAGLYDLEPRRARYWIDNILSGQSSMSRLSNVLHEMAHEESAKQSKAYMNKMIDGGVWRVIWHDDIERFSPYNLSTGEFVNLNTRKGLYTQAVLDYDNIAPYVSDTTWFQTYVADDSAISNKFNIYGIAEEFCANMIDIRFNIISTALGYNNMKVSDGMLEPYYFWTSLICSYLMDLKECSPEDYSAVIGDTDLMELLRSVYGYVSGYIDLFEVERTNTWTAIALRTWYESEEVQSGIQEYLA